MPGSNQDPVKPRRTLTFSSDRLSLSNGAGIVGLAFGSIFTLGGILALYASFASLAMLLGLLDSEPDSAFANQPLWQSLIAVAIVFLIGVAHCSAGYLLLSTWRSKIDRIKGTVKVCYGWLGLWKIDAALNDFNCVSVFPGSRWWYSASGSPVFEIALVGPADARLVIAFATRSPEAAREVSIEVSRFTGISLG